MSAGDLLSGLRFSYPLRCRSAIRRIIDPGFVDLLDDLMKDQPETGFWDANAVAD